MKCFVSMQFYCIIHNLTVMPHEVLQHYYHIKISASIIANLKALWTYEIADSRVSKVFSKLQPQ